MDRTLIDPMEQMRDFDLVEFEHDALLGIGYLIQDILSQKTNAVVAGFAAAQTAPASLSITLGNGRIYQRAQADATAAGSIRQDTTVIFQQGLNPGQTLTLTPPSAGQSQWNLIQCQFSQVDEVRDGDPNGGIVPFYNAANPSSPTNTSINTVRRGKCVLQVITGAPATTGSEVPPQPTSGWTPLYLIDLAGGQSTITTAQVLKAGPSVGTGVPSSYPVAPFLGGFQGSHHNGNPGQAPQIDLTKEVSGVLPYVNMSPVRRKLSGNLTLYVNGASGNDSNDGLSPSTAFKTIQAATNAIFSTYDLSGFAVTVSIANGTYTNGGAGKNIINLFGSPIGGSAGSAQINYIGNIGSPGSVVLSATDGNCVAVSGQGYCKLSGMTLTTTSGANTQFIQQGNCVVCASGGQVSLGDGIVFGSATANHIFAEGSGANFLNSTSYTVTGGAQYHIISSVCGDAQCNNCTITLTNNPNFSAAFASANACSYTALSNVTFVGTCTGKKFTAGLNGVINTSSSANADYLPGSVAGTASNGGVYI